MDMELSGRFSKWADSIAAKIGNMPRTQLLLFDIDGTLLNVDRSLARSVVAEILIEELGFTGRIDGFDYHGKTDSRIMRELAVLAGWSNHGDHITAMEQALVRKWEVRLAAASVTLLPGAIELLHHIDAHPNLYLALVTGNLEAAARLKLKPSGLNRLFPVGAFGSDHENRRMLPPLAIERATVHFGIEFAREDTVVIGDSHRDIDCARACDIRSIAVATGSLTMAQLAAHTPDLLVESLQSLDAIMRFVDAENSTRCGIRPH